MDDFDQGRLLFKKPHQPRNNAHRIGHNNNLSVQKKTKQTKRNASADSRKLRNTLADRERDRATLEQLIANHAKSKSKTTSNSKSMQRVNRLKQKAVASQSKSETSSENSTTPQFNDDNNSNNALDLNRPPSRRSHRGRRKVTSSDDCPEVETEVCVDSPIQSSGLVRCSSHNIETIRLDFDNLDTVEDDLNIGSPNPDFYIPIQVTTNRPYTADSLPARDLDFDSNFANFNLTRSLLNSSLKSFSVSHTQSNNNRASDKAANVNASKANPVTAYVPTEQTLMNADELQSWKHNVPQTADVNRIDSSDDEESVLYRRHQHQYLVQNWNDDAETAAHAQAQADDDDNQLMDAIYTSHYPPAAESTSHLLPPPQSFARPPFNSSQLAQTQTQTQTQPANYWPTSTKRNMKNRALCASSTARRHPDMYDTRSPDLNCNLAQDFLDLFASSS